MWKYIDTIPYMPLIVIAIVMLLTPFFPDAACYRETADA